MSRLAAPGSPIATIRIEAAGDPRTAGATYGCEARRLIERHIEIVAERAARDGQQLDTLVTRALRYRTATARQYPELAEEVDAMGQGAGIGVGMAWVLQLRAELTALGDDRGECTSLAVRTDDGRVLVAQNLDLPVAYEDLLVLLIRERKGRPTIATLTAAGQIAHIGINSAGVSLCANFIHTLGWCVGVPRYLLTRVALAHRSRREAAAAIADANRASSRNILLADTDGATNLETTPYAIVSSELDGEPLLHTNHLLSPDAGSEQAPDEWLSNSRRRLFRLRELTEAMDHPSVETVADILADRQGAPDALCHLSADDHGDWATVASVIADPAARRMWISIGPPCKANYVAVDL